MKRSFAIDVEWDEQRQGAAATLREDGSPTRRYDADDPRAAARLAFDAAAATFPDRGPARTGEGRDLRRALLWTAIAGLSVSALIAVVYFLSGGADIDDDWQIPTTTLAISVYSFLALGSAALLDRRPGSPLAQGGIGAALLAGGLALVLIWVESADDSDAFVQLWGIATVVAVAAAHISLLLTRARDDDGDAVRATLRATLGVAIVLALVICVGILAEPDDDYWWRIVGTLAVLDALGTALVPILRKLAD
jgi:hypothetical protein